MYTSQNFRTEKALRLAIERGDVDKARAEFRAFCDSSVARMRALHDEAKKRIESEDRIVKVR